MEQTERSEMSPHKIQMLGNNPKERVHQELLFLMTAVEMWVLNCSVHYQKQ
jgi:hypothetical protein